jgi:dTDP-glucose 4,6-dehydratase
MNANIDIQTDEQRLRPALSEVERLWASHEKAARLLGWKPQYAGLDGLRRGLTQTIEWFMNPAHLAAYKVDMYNL